jgi:hypothetical protein
LYIPNAPIPSVLSVEGEQQRLKEKPMKRKMTDQTNEDMLPGYDFTGKKVVRGKHAKAMHEGYVVTIHKEDGTTLVQNFTSQKNAVILDNDVRAYFPNSESVNKALRSLIALIPEKRHGLGEDTAKFGKKES